MFQQGLDLTTTPGSRTDPELTKYTRTPDKCNITGYAEVKGQKDVSVDRCKSNTDVKCHREVSVDRCSLSSEVECQREASVDQCSTHNEVKQRSKRGQC